MSELEELKRLSLEISKRIRELENASKTSNKEVSKPRGKMVTVRCKQCGCEFQARKADVKRGWGKYCSKSCKAMRQEKKTGQYARYKHRKNRSDDDYYYDSCHPFSSEALGQWD